MVHDTVLLYAVLHLSICHIIFDDLLSEFRWNPLELEGAVNVFT